MKFVFIKTYFSAKKVDFVTGGVISLPSFSTQKKAFEMSSTCKKVILLVSISSSMNTVVVLYSVSVKI